MQGERIQLEVLMMYYRDRNWISERSDVWFRQEEACIEIFGDQPRDPSNFCPNTHPHICGEKLHRLAKSY